jgi:hypothetical protein
MEDRNFYVLYMKDESADIIKIIAQSFDECVRKIPEPISKKWINISDDKNKIYTRSDYENDLLNNIDTL